MGDKARLRLALPKQRLRLCARVECPDDGSLSDWFRNSPVRYFNCEAEDGEVERQAAILEGMAEFLVV